MNPRATQSTLEILEKLLDNIDKQYAKSMPEFHATMKGHIDDMLLLLYLEFTNKGKNSIPVHNMAQLMSLMSK